jgi:formamidopyrimidine-DNA glycosylase
MPEVIEIIKYADFIKKHIKNKYIIKINILNGRYKKHGPFEMYDTITKKLPLKVIDVKTKGKFLYFVIEKGFYLFSTLGLQGGWTYKSNKSSKSNKPNKFEFPNLINYINNNVMEKYRLRSINHLNVEFVIKDGSLYFYDVLSFGTLKIINNKEELDKKLNSIGPDIMDHTTTCKIFLDKIKNSKNLDKYIGNVIVNQKVISGIGNYLRSDILWLCCISPFRKVKDLKNEEILKIYKNALLLVWGDYNYNKGIELKYIKKGDKLPNDYKRDFFVYMCNKDIYNNNVIKEELYEGSQKRFIHWVPELQK